MLDEPQEVGLDANGYPMAALIPAPSEEIQVHMMLHSNYVNMHVSP